MKNDEVLSKLRGSRGYEAQTSLVAEKMETPCPERCSPDWLKGASSNVGQASRLSPSKNPPRFLVIAGQATKPRLKAIIQSQRQARRPSYGMDSAEILENEPRSAFAKLRRDKHPVSHRVLKKALMNEEKAATDPVRFVSFLHSSFFIVPSE